jgi:hypothetical protein
MKRLILLSAGGAGSTGKQMRAFQATALKHLDKTCTVATASKASK